MTELYPRFSLAEIILQKPLSAPFQAIRWLFWPSARIVTRSILFSGRTVFRYSSDPPELSCFSDFLYKMTFVPSFFELIFCRHTNLLHREALKTLWEALRNDTIAKGTMSRRQHSLRNALVKTPSVLAHDTHDGNFGVSARQILEMNQDGLAEGNMVRGVYHRQEQVHIAPRVGCTTCVAVFLFIADAGATWATATHYHAS